MLLICFGRRRKIRTTPAAQGSLAASKGSVVFREILIFTTNPGNLLSLKQQPLRFQQMEFGPVLASETAGRTQLDPSVRKAGAAAG